MAHTITDIDRRGKRKPVAPDSTVRRPSRVDRCLQRRLSNSSALSDSINYHFDRDTPQALRANRAEAAIAPITSASPPPVCTRLLIPLQGADIPL
jgi:hypothetical protein